MSNLRIVRYPDPILHQRMKLVEAVDDGIKMLATDLVDTMKAMGGIGIAANQVGANVRVAVITSGGRSGSEIVIINPEILESDGWDSMEEGCLSYPMIRGSVNRRKWVKIKYVGLDGREHTIEAGGLMAKIIQHEIDHLNGTAIYDKMTAMDRFMNKKIIKKLCGG